MIKERLGADCMQLQLPYVENDEFCGIIDIIQQKVFLTVSHSLLVFTI